MSLSIDSKLLIGFRYGLAYDLKETSRLHVFWNTVYVVLGGLVWFGENSRALVLLPVLVRPPANNSGE